MLNVKIESQGDVSAVALLAIYGSIEFLRKAVPPPPLGRDRWIAMAIVWGTL